MGNCGSKGDYFPPRFNGPYTGNPKDYIKHFSAPIDNFETWGWLGKMWAMGEMSGKYAHHGYKVITEGMVGDGLGLHGTQGYSDEQKGKIVETLLEDDKYLKLCEKRLAKYSHKPSPKYSGNPKDYVKEFSEKLAFFLGESGPDEAKLAAAGAMQAEDGIQEVTKGLVGHESPFSRKQQAQIVKALLESPEYKKMCDKELVPLKITDPVGKNYIDKYTEALGSFESWPDEAKEGSVKTMKEEDGIEKITKGLVAHRSPFSSELQAKLVKALLESPEYMKMCDKVLVPLGEKTGEKIGEKIEEEKEEAEV